MVYVTGRTRTLTMSGTMTGKIHSEVNRVGMSVTYEHHGHSSYSASGFGCSINTSASSEGPNHWNYRVDIVAAAGWPSLSVGAGIVDSGSYPTPGSVDKDIGGSYIFSADVEEVVTIGVGSVDLQGFANYGGNGSTAKDFPGGLTLVYYERPRAGGTVSATCTAGGLTNSASRPITALDRDNYVIGYGCALQCAVSTDNYSITTSVTGTASGVGLVDGFSASSADGSATCGGGVSVTCAGTTLPGTNQDCSLSITPDKVCNIAGVIRAMEGAYPGTLTLALNAVKGQPFQYLSVGSAWSTSVTQRKRVSGAHLNSVAYTGSNIDEQQGIQFWLTPASLTAAGEDPLLWRIPIRAYTFAGLLLAKAASTSLESSCLPAHWTNVANTTLTGAGPLVVTVGAGIPGTCRTTLPVADSSLKGSSFSGVSFAGVRYLDIEISADADGLPFEVMIGAKLWQRDYTGAPLVANMASRHVKIDLCGRSGSVVGIDTWDTKWPYASVGPVVVLDGPLNGVTNVAALTIQNLAASHTYTLTSLALVVSNHRRVTVLPAFNHWVQSVPLVVGSGVTTTTFVRRFLTGDTDWRLSLEKEDVTRIETDNGAGAFGHTFTVASIADLVNNLNGNSGAYPSDGYTATLLAPAVSATGFLHDDFLNRNSSAVYLYGAGAYYSGGTWSYGFDLDLSGGALNIPAQLLIDSIDWYPGCGDVLGLGGGAGGGGLELRAAAILRGAAWGAVFDVNSTQDAGIVVSVRDHTSLAAEGSATTDTSGGYRTGSAWVKGSSFGDVTAGLSPSQVAANYLFPSRYRKRFSFGIPVAASVLAIDGPRQWLHIGMGKQIWTYHLADFTAAYQSGDYPIDAWLDMQTDARTGSFLAVGHITASNVAKVYLSTDGGATGSEVVSVTANSAVIERDSERGYQVFLYGDASDNVYYQRSSDGGQTFDAPSASQYNGAQLVGKLISIAQDPRRHGIMTLVCLTAGSTKVLSSTDFGESWTLALS